MINIRFEKIIDVNGHIRAKMIYRKFERHNIVTLSDLLKFYPISGRIPDVLKKKYYKRRI